jgi:rfaE bifunctional protein kinase chain/domain
MESVASSLKKLADTHVLVIGDVMLDRYWMGSVDRISPEAPVPIVSVKQTEDRVGGAGNVARNITALGGKCTLMGIVGDDSAGGKVEKIIKDSSVYSALYIEPGYETVTKLRVLSRNQQLIRADFESIPSQESIDQLQGQFKDLVKDHDVVVFSDYGKGCLVQIKELIEIARKSGKCILVDPKGTEFSRYQNATMITPNLSEFQAVVGDVSTDGAMKEKALAMIAEYGFDQLLITLSDKGMVLFNANGSEIRVSAQSQEVFDVSGAGDTVISVMAMMLAANVESEVGVEIANYAAGTVIKKLGTATTTQNEIIEFMNAKNKIGGTTE